MTADLTPPRRHHLLHLCPTPHSGPTARLVLTRELRQWNLDHLIDNATLVAGELVANAIRLGDIFTVAFHLTSHSVKIEVTDTSPAEPTIKNPTPDAENGRGMLLIEALSTDWGVRHHPRGKTVWALVD